MVRRRLNAADSAAMAFTAMEWLTFPEAVPQFAAPHKAFQFTDFCTIVQPRRLAERVESNRIDRLEVDIPIEAIYRLSLTEIVNARNTDLIRAIQEIVASFRNNPLPSASNETADKWNHLAHDFRRWLTQETLVGRKGYLHNWTLSGKKLRLSWISLADKPVGLFLGAATATIASALGANSVLATAIALGSAAIGITVASGAALAAGARADSAVYQQPSPPSPDNLKWDPTSEATR